ncbi:hypothetical protein N7462_009338 [Penicillium macrosclerotiorum]|uniref:uncharacterized protein n=1 Tax=Penicillium macrosclerotiorum TaxID=303699 RepID=UPI0025469242|nr:uncharacterized protein N7462_009338 [Penicillium macrosclerotiorum]KAJ5673899.1 hypothetical protein N7462_009338 [Penicillium macrosclerotiorum]
MAMLYVYIPSIPSTQRKLVLHIYGRGMAMGEVPSNNLTPFNSRGGLLCCSSLDGANSFDIDIEPSHISISDKSADGGFVAGVALLAHDRALFPPLAKQFLVYPMQDDRNTVSNKSNEAFAIQRTADSVAAWATVLGE